MNVAGVIASLSTGLYDVTRTDAGDYGGGLTGPLGGPFMTAGDGRYRPGAQSFFTIAANIQPLNGRDLLRLPEGLRNKQTIRIYTATQLQTADAPNGVNADTIAYQGATYQVETVEPWNENGGFFKVIAAKVQP